MFDGFYPRRAVKVIMLAQEEARVSGHNFVGHLRADSAGPESAKGLGVARQGFGNPWESIFKDGRVEVRKNHRQGLSALWPGRIPFTRRAKRVLGTLARESTSAWAQLHRHRATCWLGPEL